MEMNGVSGGNGLQSLQGLGQGLGGLSERELLEKLVRMLEQFFKESMQAKQGEEEKGPEGVGQTEGGPEGATGFQDLVSQIMEMLPPELRQELQNMLQQANPELANAAAQLGLGAGGAQMSLAPSTGSGVAFA